MMPICSTMNDHRSNRRRWPTIWNKLMSGIERWPRVFNRRWNPPVAFFSLVRTPRWLPPKLLFRRWNLFPSNRSSAYQERLRIKRKPESARNSARTSKVAFKRNDRHWLSHLDITDLHIIGDINGEYIIDTNKCQAVDYDGAIWARSYLRSSAEMLADTKWIREVILKEVDSRGRWLRANIPLVSLIDLLDFELYTQVEHNRTLVQTQASAINSFIHGQRERERVLSVTRRMIFVRLQIGSMVRMTSIRIPASCRVRVLPWVY